MRSLPGTCFRRILTTIAIVVVLFAGGVARAASFDPGADWRTIETEHFRLHFPERIEDTARKAARIFEEIYSPITEQWSWKPWSYTEVILVDNTDDANGLSSVLPYNWMLLYVTPPTPDSSLAHYDDWLRMLIVHEFTHIVQIDAVGGFWSVLRVPFGKTAAPTGTNATWIREGIAQIAETFMTQGGRGRGSFSEMMVRTAILEGDFPHIDEADGLSWKWPGYKGAYVYGLKFIQYLIETYGEEKFNEFDRRIRSSPLLWMINHQARNVYGKTFYELWNEWQRVLTDRYTRMAATVGAGGLTSVEPVVVQHRDEQYDVPALSPQGDKLVYSVTSPHKFAQVRMQDLATGETETLYKKGQHGVQYSWSRDGTKLAWASMSGYKRYNRFFDLWLYDFEVEKAKKRARKLTNGERARDPDFNPQGTEIVFVAGENGTDKLKRIDVESGEITVLTPDAPCGTQYANPRYSPDGRSIALSIWKPGDGWRVYRMSAEGTNPVRLTRGTGLVIESRPVWTPDGRFVVFASDESGVSNIYRVSAEGGGEQRVSNILSGLFQPQVAPDGTIVAQVYRNTGFEIGRFTPAPVVGAPEKKGKTKEEGKKVAASRIEPSTAGGEQSQDVVAGGVRQAPPAGEPELATQIAGADAPGAWYDRRFPQRTEEERASVKEALKSPAPRKSRIHANPGAGTRPKMASTNDAMFAVPADGPGEADADGLRSRKYVAFSHSLFRPRFIAPGGAVLDNAVFIYLATGGADPLRWHNWAASANYRTDAKYFGYNLLYTYNRYRPLFGVSASQFAVDYGLINFFNVRTVHYFEKRRAVSAFFAIPIQKHSFSVAYFFENHEPKTDLTAPEAAALNLGHFAGLRGEYRYGDWEKFPASISAENGRQIRLTGQITNTRMGSSVGNSQEIFSGDWREFINLGRHNVLALRAGGGITWGDQLVQGTFGLGGAMGEGSFGAGGSYNYLPLRGLPVSSISSTRAMLVSSEWRFPLAYVLRGAGTAPLFLKDISGAIFADFGNGWNANNPNASNIKTFFDEFLLSLGAELRGDFIVGHGLPIHGRIGYGIVVTNRYRLAGLTDPIMGSAAKYGLLILALGTAF